jgi:hypothetical protein
MRRRIVSGGSYQPTLSTWVWESMIIGEPPFLGGVDVLARAPPDV